MMLLFCDCTWQVLAWVAYSASVAAGQHVAASLLATAPGRCLPGCSAEPRGVQPETLTLVQALLE